MLDEHLTAGQLYDGIRNQGHLEECETCRRKLAWIDFMREMAPTEDAAEPPVAVLTRALQLGGSRQAGALLRWVRASLVFDSLSLITDSSVRQTDSNMRQITYRADSLRFTVTLQLAQRRGYTIVGQAQSDDGQSLGGIDVCLQTRERLYTTATDPWGEFQFRGLPASEYRITALLPAGPVLLESFAALSA